MSRNIFFFFFLLFCPLNLFSWESPVPAFEGEPSALIHGHVDAISGAFVDSAVDLIVEGPEPITLVRAYCTWDEHPDPSIGVGWHFNIPTEFHAREIGNVVYVTEDSGSGSASLFL